MTCSKRIALALVITALAALVATPAAGQSLEQRIAHVRAKQRQQRLEQQAAERRARAMIVYKLTRRIDTVTLDEVPAREAFEWWAQRVDVPLVIDWETMELEGVNPDQPISLEMEKLRAWHVLRLIAGQAAPQTRLVHELTPGYVRLMPRRVANRRTVVRVYDVADLVMSIPQFTDPPRIGLGESNRVGGDNQRGGNDQSLFGNRRDNGGDDADDTPTRQENGEALAQLIREVIEPDVWAETAGGNSRIHYFDNRLIVRAPPYVHRQIGVPVAAPHATLPRPATDDAARNGNRVREDSDSTAQE